MMIPVVENRNFWPSIRMPPECLDSYRREAGKGKSVREAGWKAGREISSTQAVRVQAGWQFVLSTSTPRTTCHVASSAGRGDQRVGAPFEHHDASAAFPTSSFDLSFQSNCHIYPTN